MAGLARRSIKVHVLRHERTGLLLATSDDLYGLAMHAHSLDEIRERLPGVIRDLLEAEGYRVESLTTQSDDRLSRTGFGLPAFIADAALSGGDQRHDA